MSRRNARLQQAFLPAELLSSSLSTTFFAGILYALQSLQIGINQFRRSKSLIEKHILPLTYHSQVILLRTIIFNSTLYWQNCFHFLYCHLEPPFPTNVTTALSGLLFWLLFLPEVRIPWFPFHLR